MDGHDGHGRGSGLGVCAACCGDTAEGFGDEARAWLVQPPSTALLPPVWEVLLAPRGWAELELLTRPSSGSSMKSISAHHGASEQLRTALFEALLGVIVRPARPGAGGGWSEEDVTLWKTTTLVELCALCLHARGSSRCAELLTTALAEGFRVGREALTTAREAGALAASWLEVEGALECAVAMVRAHRRLMRGDDGTRSHRHRGDDLDLVKGRLDLIEGRLHPPHRAEPFVPMGQEWHTLCVDHGRLGGAAPGDEQADEGGRDRF